MTTDTDRARAALAYIIPILAKYRFRWVITGGFAAYVFGVDRDITDIDIDIDTSKDAPEFQAFVEDVRPFMTQELEHYVDQNYDNYNFEVTYGGQIIDICPMAEMNVTDKLPGAYVHFYKDGFPEMETVPFHGFDLPLLSKRLIIKNKEMLVWQRESDHRDIAGLREIMEREVSL